MKTAASYTKLTNPSS